MIKKFHILVFMLLLPQAAHAGGFYIQEQSVSGLGSAFAGAVADTPDASTIYYNPAGMTDLGEAQTTIGAHYISPDSSFENNGSSAATTPGTGGADTAIAGSDGGDPFDAALVPNFYAAAPLTMDGTLWVGFGVSAPFGLENEYESDFFGRYDSTKNELLTINTAPSIAWAPTKFISVGAGIDIQYADATLTAAIPSPITAGGPVPGTDGFNELSGDTISAGFNAGVIIKPDSKTRIGAHYRHTMRHKLRGNLRTRIPADVPGVGGTISNEDISAELDLPAIVSVGASRQVTDRLKVMGSVTWHKWSNFNDIPVARADGSTSRTPQNYDDSWAFAAGARYKATERLELKGGVQYDQTPTVDHFRSTRVPDGDRTWIAAGASYDINDAWTLDVSGTYVDISKEDIDLSETIDFGGGTSASYDIQGSTEGNVGILSAGLRYKFDAPFNF